eukprot:1040838-Prorocentrum_minimum.AAC.4
MLRMLSALFGLRLTVRSVCLDRWRDPGQPEGAAEAFSERVLEGEAAVGERLGEVQSLRHAG